VPIGPVGLEERAKVQLVDHVQDEPGQVVGWQPVTQVGRQQERLVAVTDKEVVGHGRSYGGPDPFAELLADRQIQVLLGRLPGLPQPAVDPSQRHRLAHWLVNAAVQDPDEQHPPSRRVELVRLGQELHPGQLRHPLVGDDHRDRRILAAQPLQHPKSHRG
jgi:hypothetical protein